MANTNLSDGSQESSMASSDKADTMFGHDQAETNMVKLVDGKLTPIGDTEDDVADDQLRNRYSDDIERGLNDTPDGSTYETSEASLRNGEGMDSARMPDSPIAEADLTGNPDAGDTVETGLPSEDN